MAFELAFQDQVVEGGQGGHRAVAGPGDHHRHDTVRDFPDIVELEQLPHDGLIHLFIGLVNEDLFDIPQCNTALLQVFLHGPGNHPDRIFIDFVPLHFDEQLVAVAIGIVGFAHSQQVGVIQGVGAGQVGKDATVFFGCFDHRCPGSVGINHAVHIMGIANPGEDFGPDHQDALRIAGLDQGFGHDHSLQPTGAAEGQVKGHRVRVLDFKLVFDPRCNGGHNVGVRLFRLHLSQVLSHDKIIEAFPVHVFQGFFGRKGGDIGGVQVVADPTPFPYTGDFVELGDDLRVGLFEFLSVGAVKFVGQKVRVGNGNRGEVATGG